MKNVLIGPAWLHQFADELFRKPSHPRPYQGYFLAIWDEVGGGAPWIKKFPQLWLILHLIKVSLYFAGCLYRGNRSTKVSAGSFDAFDSPNLPPLVTMKVKIEGKKFYSLIL